MPLPDNNDITAGLCSGPEAVAAFAETAHARWTDVNFRARVWRSVA